VAASVCRDDELDDSTLRERPDEEGRFEAGVAREDFDLMRHTAYNV
jgi:hypothetical protein